MSDVGIGAVLKEARTDQERGLSEAASATSMRVAQVEALEDDRFEEFGGDVYAKGFLRSYATWLGLDPEPLLERYRRYIQHDRSDALALATTNSRTSDAPSDLPVWLVRGVALVGVVALAFGLIQLVNSRAPAPADEPIAIAPEPVEEPSPQPSDAADPTPSATPTPSPSPAIEGVELTLAFEDRSWVSVTVDGDPQREGVFEAGDVLDVAGDGEVVVVFGNAGGVRALHNGENVGPFGSSGEVRTVRFTPEGVEEV